MSLNPKLQTIIEHESTRLNHHYLGVEHLFLAMLQLPESITAQILKHTGLSPYYLAYLVEQSLGQSPDRRYWDGFRSTPRFEKVLSIAQRYTPMDVLNERELLLAMLDEGDSIPVRMLEGLDADLRTLSQLAASWRGLSTAPLTLPIETSLPLSMVEQGLLRELFSKSHKLEVVKELPNNSDQRLYVIQVWTTEKESAYSVARFDHPTHIMQETYRTESLARHLAQTVAGVGGIAIPSQHRLAALRYQFQSKTTLPLDLLSYAQTVGLQLAGQAVESLYHQLGDNWWQAKERYRFPIWREYEFLLPPTLEVEFGVLEPEVILRPLGSWTYQDEVPSDTMIELQDFTVENCYAVNNALLLKAGKGDESVYQGSQILLRGLPDLKPFSIGRSVRYLRGRVTKTREATLIESASSLIPPFKATDLEFDTPIGLMPNPILALPSLLQHEVDGFLAQIHGGLLLENIILGDQAWVIHLDQTRLGHILFDWATLELSILQEVIAPLTDGEWDSLWKIGAGLQAIHHLQRPDLLAHVAEALNLLQVLREIVTPLLGQQGDWREYYAALTIVSLAQMTTPHLSLAARRLALVNAMVSAQLFQQLQFELQSQVPVGIQLQR